MAEAKKGDIVLVHYTGKLADGTVFDTSKERHPLKFTIGNGQVIAGFEQAIIGMSPGDSKTVRIPPARGLRGAPQGPRYHLQPEPAAAGHESQGGTAS